MKRTSKCEEPMIRKSISLRLLKLILLIVFMIGLSEDSALAASMVRITDGDEWHYLKGVQTPPRYWNQNGFDDSAWLKGRSGFGYGNVSNRTFLEDMQGNYSTVYARREFNINNMYVVTGMTMSVVCDGPFKAYVNGVEVISSKNSLPEQLDIGGFIHELIPGSNVLSVECTNDDINSKDFSFIPYFDVSEYQGGDVR